MLLRVQRCDSKSTTIRVRHILTIRAYGHVLNLVLCTAVSYVLVLLLLLYGAIFFWHLVKERVSDL